MDVAVENIHPRQSKVQFIQTIISTRRILLGLESSDMGNVLIYIYNQTVLLAVSTEHEYGISHGLIMTSPILHGITRKKTCLHVCADRVSCHLGDPHPALGHYHPELQFLKGSGWSGYPENHKHFRLNSLYYTGLCSIIKYILWVQLNNYMKFLLD